MLKPGSADRGHVFNDDLLANPQDLDEARRRFPKSFQILHHPELIVLFQDQDVPANAAKRRSRKLVLWAVSLGVLALLGASASPILHTLPAGVVRFMAFISALAGIASVAIGVGGAMWGSSKREWLRRRLQTERLRQFHFQCFVCHPNELADVLKGGAALDVYLAHRRAWFSYARNRLVDGRDAEFENLLRDSGERDVWLYETGPSRLAPREAEDLVELFRAYRQLRIEHQLRYANIKLSEDDRGSIRTQVAILANASLIGLVVLICLHILIALSVAANPSQYVVPEWLHVITIWAAIAGLAIGTLNEGLRPGRELERYQNYRAAVRAIRDRFDSASSPSERLDAMADMERLSFHEMVDFLRVHNDARFLF